MTKLNILQKRKNGFGMPRQTWQETINGIGV
jgi:hypothetical protein